MLSRVPLFPRLVYLFCKGNRYSKTVRNSLKINSPYLSYLKYLFLSHIYPSQCLEKKCAPLHSRGSVSPRPIPALWPPSKGVDRRTMRQSVVMTTAELRSWCSQSRSSGGFLCCRPR